MPAAKRSKRDLRQLELANSLLKNKRGSIEAVTGFGKTYTVLLALAILVKKLDWTPTVVVIVPTRPLVDQWEENLKQKGIENFEVWTFNKARTEESIIADVVIIDEAHNAASLQNSRIFGRIRSDYLWCMTATMERRDQRHKLITAAAPIVGTVDLDEAKENNYVSDFKVYDLALTLNSEESAAYSIVNDKYHKYMTYFDHSFGTMKGCLSNPYYASNYAERVGLNPTQVKVFAVNAMRAIQERKAFLNAFPRRLEVAAEITKRATGKVITFGSDIESAKKITELIGPESKAYHSKLAKSSRDKRLEDFEAGKFRVINTAKALDEGADIKDLEVAIIYSGTSSKRSQVQRIGRAIRVKEGKTALVVNIHLADTQDERWSQRRLASIEYVPVESIDEIIQ